MKTSGKTSEVNNVTVETQGCVQQLMVRMMTYTWPAMYIVKMPSHTTYKYSCHSELTLVRCPYTGGWRGWYINYLHLSCRQTDAFRQPVKNRFRPTEASFQLFEYFLIFILGN